MSNLDVLIEPLKRELAVPGTYDTYFPNTDDTNLLDSLMDAFSECQLDGYFSTYSLDLETAVVTPDMSAAGGSLVLLYAGMRIIRAKIRELNLVERYQAGSAEYEVQRSSTLLKEELRYLEKRRDELVQASRVGSVLTTVFDNYFTRSATDWTTVGGLYPAELG